MKLPDKWTLLGLVAIAIFILVFVVSQLLYGLATEGPRLSLEELFSRDNILRSIGMTVIVCIGIFVWHKCTRTGKKLNNKAKEDEH